MTGPASANAAARSGPFSGHRNYFLPVGQHARIVPERFVTRAQPIDLSRPTAIQLHLGKLVAAGVAIRDIVGVTARHGGRLFALCGWSIPPEPDRYSKPARISPFPSGRPPRRRARSRRAASFSGGRRYGYTLCASADELSKILI
jgi:hypothetical protein